MKHNNILNPVEFHDVILPTAEKAQSVYQEACNLFNATVVGLRGEYFIKLLGNVVRFPSWFTIQPQH